MQCIGAVVEKAAELGAKAWIYDELGWPSGTAGGTIPRKGPAFQHKFLECHEIQAKDRAAIGSILKTQEAVAVFAWNPPGQPRLIELGQLASLDSKEKVLLFSVGLVAGYLDTLDRPAPAAFLKATHEAYLRKFGRHFGKTIPGAFTDEPSHRTYDLRLRVKKLPWTGRLAREFKVRRGYDLIRNLPSLIYDLEQSPKVRRDFRLTVSELFIESYGRQIYEWCDEHGIAFTGHYEFEVPLNSQVAFLTNVMALYEWMHIPGFDLLGKNRAQYQRTSSILLAKQPASVANQTGRKRVLCEAFGVAGWDLSPAGIKWMDDWLLALGTNLLCYHGFFYSVAGHRKRDAPPDFFWRQPWWDLSRKLHDRAARLCFMLSQGRPERDVVVIHPIRTAWITHRPQDYHGAGDFEQDALEVGFDAWLDALVRRQIDFDLVDEGFLARRGRLANGRLRVGSASYSCAVVPPGALTLEPETRRLLNQLADSGGTVVAFDPPPRLEGAMETSEPLLSPNAALAANMEEAGEILDKALANRPAARGDGAKHIALHTRRLSPTRKALFVANTSFEQIQADLEIPGRWSVEEWDPGSGDIGHRCAAQADGIVKMNLSLAPAQSLLLLLDQGRRKRACCGQSAKEEILANIEKWAVEPRAQNILVFDACRFRASRRGKSELMPVAVARQKAGRSGFLLEFDFINRLSGGPGRIWFAFEGRESYRISVNGRQTIVSRRAPRFLDDACAAAEIGPLMRPGLNRISLEPVSSSKQSGAARPPVENAFLLGEFGVRQEACFAALRGATQPAKQKRWLFAIVDPQPGPGPWHACGYPFFLGPMAYTAQVELNLPAGPVSKEGSVWLRAEDLREAAQVFVNGRDAGQMLWPPWEIEVTHLLRRGANEISLVVHGNLRNVFGPWHVHDDRRKHGFGGQESRERESWHDEYDFVPVGLLGKVQLLRRMPG
jgi:hypothetical protein